MQTVQIKVDVYPAFNSVSFKCGERTIAQISNLIKDKYDFGFIFEPLTVYDNLGVAIIESAKRIEERYYDLGLCVEFV